MALFRRHIRVLTCNIVRVVLLNRSVVVFLRWKMRLWHDSRQYLRRAARWISPTAVLLRLCSRYINALELLYPPTGKNLATQSFEAMILEILKPVSPHEVENAAQVLTPFSSLGLELLQSLVPEGRPTYFSLPVRKTKINRHFHCFRPYYRRHRVIATILNPPAG